MVEASLTILDDKREGQCVHVGDVNTDLKLPNSLREFYELELDIKIKAAVDIFLGTAMLLAERYDLAKIPATELACAVRA